MLDSVDRFLERRTRAGVILIASLLLVVVAALDQLTGYELSFSVFYLVPVGVATWYAGRASGLAFSVLASAVWYAVDWSGGYAYQSPAIPIWNALVRLAFFVIFTFLLSEVGARLSGERFLAHTDVLTGVLNSRAFVEKLEHDLALAARGGTPLTLAYIDMDDFKWVNDTHGHAEGDAVLRTVGQTLLSGTRRTDSVARLGGDEFALILPGSDREGARELLTRVREQLGEALTGRPGAVSCSIGAAVFVEPPRGSKEAIAAADGLMYEAKAAGKDATMFHVFPA